MLQGSFWIWCQETTPLHLHKTLHHHPAWVRHPGACIHAFKKLMAEIGLKRAIGQNLHMLGHGLARDICAINPCH
jgi:hypothetical protein